MENGVRMPRSDPLLNKERYLGDPNFREFYMNKLAEFERADAIFAISQSAAQEVIEYTDIASDRVLNISSAVGEEFAVIDYSAERIQSLKTNTACRMSLSCRWR